MLPRRVLALLLAAPLLASAACGDAQRMQPEAKYATPSAQPSVSATIKPAKPSPTSAAPSKKPSAPTATGAPVATDAPAASGGTEVKALDTNQFEPAVLEVKAGTEVTFTNGTGFHTVTGGEEAADPASPVGNNTLDTPGKAIKIKFDKAGEFPYFCNPHLSAGMKGKIVVS